MSIVTRLETAFLLVFTFAAGAFALQEPAAPSVPDVPEVTGPVVREVESEAMMSNDTHPADGHTLYQPLWKTVTITECGGSPVEGMLKITSNLILTVTNTASNRMDIRHFYLTDILSLEVTKWKAMEQSGGIYKFVPSEYRVVCGGSFIYTGNIPLFNIFEIEANGKREGVFTIFYDRWVPGQNGQFHWENSQSFDFSYNFTHALRGVVNSIDFGSAPGGR